MSADGNSARPRRYSTGQVLALIAGSILLLPGGCALVFIVGGMWEMVRKGESFDWNNNAFAQLAVIIWAISFVISAAGVALIWFVRKRARSPA